MTKEQVQILYDYNFTSIRKEEVYNVIPKSLIEDPKFVSTQLLNLSNSTDINHNNAIIELFWLNSNNVVFEQEFNQLLENRFHYHHQRLVKYLQDVLKYESSIPIIDKLLKSNLQELYSYTGSEDNVIAKWYSHALAGIGTEESINVIKEHQDSPNVAIAYEMKYRLRRMKEKSERKAQIKVQKVEKVSLIKRIWKNIFNG